MCRFYWHVKEMDLKRKEGCTGKKGILYVFWNLGFQEAALWNDKRL
jgi:hypothetical protein